MLAPMGRSPRLPSMDSQRRRPVSAAEVAGDGVAGGVGCEGWRLDGAACFGDRAAGVEVAAGRRADWVGHVALQHHAPALDLRIGVIVPMVPMPLPGKERNCRGGDEVTL